MKEKKTLSQTQAEVIYQPCIKEMLKVVLPETKDRSIQNSEEDDRRKQEITTVFQDRVLNP